ncbi:type I-E CRISPR-associated endoribonuclease Cas2e [Frankia sp. R82]|uniref:type I-E CRISPR-associated endoribonuclease Cas2e n=1 Tax=Frankia sp. R82 TaxID=2950553 RepID=UPI0020449A3F|nr:type I-E CRISPR-associated endoribonuclease Cas2e [Frankia sp. R82]MCM3884606.1 type I-E CRISPR-associated endoribonuclease Cas2e [Frankia sp. R82]
MTVIVLIAAPEGLRGHLTLWMIEINVGVYVGNPSARVRDRLWTLLTQRIGDGQAVMIEPANNEQGWAARTAGRDRYHPIDYDGLMLFARPRR